MELLLIDGLPFVEITLCYRNMCVVIPNVLVDTGSAGTIFSSDMLEPVGIVPEADDVPYYISGVGGTEIVYRRCVDCIKIREFQVSGFEIEAGGMDYGFDINGILGMDFFTQAKAVINLAECKIYFQG